VGMRFHVAREGAVLGEFDERIFRNKVFAGEIRPNDLYWREGFREWRPVSEFRVARKTEVIVLEARTSRPPAIHNRPSYVGLGGLIAVAVLLALVVIAFMALAK